MNVSGNSTITLQQGKKYKDASIKKYSAEGFENANLLKNNNNITQPNINTELLNTYSSTLENYNKVKDNIILQAKNYISRTSQSNPYLNKIIVFNNAGTNNAFYVTNRGIAKWFPSTEIYNSVLGNNGCPSISDIITVDIPWSSNYTVEGASIPTVPPLIVGTHMTMNQSCGNEGTNVYANTMVKDTSVTYKGCFQDDTTTPLMTFIGGSVPSTPIKIINGDFSQPTISNNTYQNIGTSSSVPGWDVNNAYLLNNSSNFGVALPYPFGTQCVGLREMSTISQTIKLNSGTYNLVFYACGRNCCDNSGQSNPIDIQLNGTTISTVKPPINYWTEYKIPFRVETSGNNTIMFKGTTASSDRSTAIQHIGITLTTSNVPDTSSVPDGRYNYETCKNTAIDGGHKYFALQNVNSSKGTGYCAVSNDFVAPSKNGPAYVITGGIQLWSSNTPTNSANTATLTEQGALSVLNSGGTSIFSTSVPTVTKNNVNKPFNYIGCYKDTGNRALPTSNGNGKTYDTCSSITTAKGAKYFGLQYVQGNQTAECWSGSDLIKAKQYGLATNCSQLKDGTWVGGSWSNAVYNNVEPTVPYFLILQDDGNMCIYKGSGPQDSQGNIWCSGTNGKQQKPNPNFKASNGKFGKNYINSTTSLASGDFIGSNDGSIYLMMQSDGNLVLYTSQQTSNCKPLSNGFMGGGPGANAIYELNQVGALNKLYDVAYVDQNSKSYLYPESSVTSTNTYSKVNAYDSEDKNISGGQTSGVNLEQCKQSCNLNAKCYGVEYNTDIKTCVQKDNTIYLLNPIKLPNSSFSELYIKDKTISEGFTQTNVDTVKLNNYVSGNQLFSSDVVSTLTKQINPVDKQQLEQLESQLSLLSAQLNTDNNNSAHSLVNVDNRSNIQTKFINLFANQYDDTKSKIKNLHENMPNYTNILEDSNIIKSSSINTFIMWCFIFIILILIMIKIYSSI